jgi:hypothetical protein
MTEIFTPKQPCQTKYQKVCYKVKNNCVCICFYNFKSSKISIRNYLQLFLLLQSITPSSIWIEIYKRLILPIADKTRYIQMKKACNHIENFFHFCKYLKIGMMSIVRDKMKIILRQCKARTKNLAMLRKIQ